MSSRFLCILLLLFVCSLTLLFTTSRAKVQTAPGFSTTVQESALNYVIAQVLPLVQAEVEKQTIPDIEEDVKTPVGRVHFTISNARLKQFSAGEVTVQVVQDTGFHIVVRNANVDMHADWKYREKSWPHISDHGTVDASVGVSVAVRIKVWTDEQGHLMTDIIGVELDLFRLDLKLHGGASWLYNLFISTFKGSIKNSIVKALSSAITGDLNEQIKKQVATIEYVHHVGSADANVQLDYSILQTVFNAQYPVYFQAGAKGLFSQVNGIPYSGPNPPVIPYQPLTPSRPSMMQILVTDFFINTFAWSWYQSGKLVITLTDADIPEKIPLRLTTTSLSAVAPELNTRYPNKPMQLTLSSFGTDQSKSPTANITEARGAGVFATGSAVFSVIDGPNIIDAFTIDMLTALALKVAIAEGNLITGSVSLDSLKLSLQSSEVGTVNVVGLNSLLEATLQYVAVPLLNAVLAQGFPIPTISGLTLQSPQILFKDRYIGVATNFTFVPEPRIWRT